MTRSNKIMLLPNISVFTPQYTVHAQGTAQGKAFVWKLSLTQFAI